MATTGSSPIRLPGASLPSPRGQEFQHHDRKWEGRRGCVDEHTARCSSCNPTVPSSAEGRQYMAGRRPWPVATCHFRSGKDEACPGGDGRRQPGSHLHRRSQIWLKKRLSTRNEKGASRHHVGAPLFGDNDVAAEAIVREEYLSGFAYAAQVTPFSPISRGTLYAHSLHGLSTGCSQANSLISKRSNLPPLRDG